MPEKANDPLAIWHRFLGDLESGTNGFFNKAMESKEFSQAMNQAGGLSAAAQKATSEAMEKYLVGMNLPSRVQLAGMGERLQTIESQLAEIKTMLHRMQPNGAPSGGGASRPPRTKRPPQSDKSP